MISCTYLSQKIQNILFSWTIERQIDREKSALEALMSPNPNNVRAILEAVEKAALDNPFDPKTDKINDLSADELKLYMAMLLDSGLICREQHKHEAYCPHIRSDMPGTTTIKLGYVFLTIKGYDLLDELRGTSWRDTIFKKNFETAKAE